MTVEDNTSRNQYSATSGQTVFAYTFEIVDKGDIVVLKNGTTLSEGTNYTVSGVGAENGGNITLTVGATAGDIMTLYRDMAYVRTQNYADSGDFLASEVNTDFDNLWLAGEQTNRSFSQSIRKPITDSDSISMELPEAATRVNSFLTFDSTGAVSVESLASGNNPTNIFRQQFTGNGSTTVFTLATDPGSAAAVMIYIDGVYQQEGTYTVSGTSLTFTEAPPVNASIEAVLYRVTDIGTTDAGSVTYLPAGTGAVQTTVQTKLRESVSVKDFGAVGDGVTDDTAAIQAALDYAADNRKTLVFTAGTYLHDEITLSSKNDFSIVGENATSLGSSSYGGGSAFSFTDCSNIKIEKLHFDRKNSYASGSRQNGISLYGLQNSIISENIFEDCNSAIVIDEGTSRGSNNNLITNNIGEEGRLAYSSSNETDLLLNQSFVAIGVDGNTYYCENNIIQNNTIKTYRAVLANFTKSLIVQSNVCENATDSAIYFANDNFDFVCDGNIVVKAGKDGIKAIKGSSYGSISSNTVYGAGQNKSDGRNCILVDDDEGDSSGFISITGNSCRLNDDTGKAAPASRGISVRASNVAVSGNSIYASTARADDEGISIVADGTIAISNINIDGNVLKNIYLVGIQLTGSGGSADLSNVSITDNVIVGNSNAHSNSYGISIDASVSGGGTIDDVLISGNTIDTFKQAFEFDAVTNVRIVDNFVKNINSGVAAIASSNSPSIYLGNNFHDESATHFLGPFGALSFTANTTSFTADHTIVNGYGWDVYDNDGATGSVRFYLPRANPGCKLSFVRSAAQDIILDSAGAEKIENTAPGTGTYSSNQTMSTTDAACTLVCIKAGRWELSAGGY